MKKFIAIAAATLLSQGVAAQGIPVYDNVGFMNALQQIAALGKQYALSAQQLQAMQTQITMMTGARGYSTMLNTGQVWRTLPTDAAGVMNLATGGTYGNLSASVASIKQTTSTLVPSDFSNKIASDQWQADLNRAATQKALSQEAYNASAQRLANLEALMAEISQTKDPKAIAELQARIAVEQGLGQNYHAQVQSLAMMMESNRQLAELQARDISIRTAGGDRPMPRVQMPRM